ncbi:hypothetical protein F7725_014873 [Dissostichus mawsoni]|uniref:Uncharacterized protein n=1 Tax=Dissostichus mawsoni TaxID=36200 RepID=A0A7J5YFX6_DISMA|nr:hypothetical protein F7725_014873 [Dissostichus mawsoni]
MEPTLVAPTAVNEKKPCCHWPLRATRSLRQKSSLTSRATPGFTDIREPNKQTDRWDRSWKDRDASVERQGPLGPEPSGPEPSGPESGPLGPEPEGPESGEYHRTQEVLQAVGHSLHLLNLRVLHSTKVKNPAVSRRNLRKRSRQEVVRKRSRQEVVRKRKMKMRKSYQAGGGAERSDCRFELSSEELSQVSVVMKILHCCLLKEQYSPDVQRVDGLPQPGGQLHAVQTAPGSGEEAGREGVKYLYKSFKEGRVRQETRKQNRRRRKEDGRFCPSPFRSSNQKPKALTRLASGRRALTDRK